MNEKIPENKLLLISPEEIISLKFSFNVYYFENNFDKKLTKI